MRMLAARAVFSFRPMAAQSELQKICQPLLPPLAALSDSLGGGRARARAGGKAEQKSQTPLPFGEIRFCKGATRRGGDPPAASSTLHFVEEG